MGTGVHSYLSYLRDRLLLVRELLAGGGSCFMQIGDENLHRVSIVMDEVFGPENRVATISYATTGGSSAKTLPQVANYLLWYAKDRSQLKYRRLYEPLTRAEIIESFSWHVMVELPDGECRKPTPQERFDPDQYLPKGARVYRRMPWIPKAFPLPVARIPTNGTARMFHCGAKRHWAISKEGRDRLGALNRLEAREGQDSLMWKKYEDEVPGRRINNLWVRPRSAKRKRYVVQTAEAIITRCLLMTTDPGDLVLDPTCGSGTTAEVAEKWGRRWITCDTSRVTISLTRERLMTAVFDYYDLAHPSEGVGAGFRYASVGTVSARTLGYDESTVDTVLYDQPKVDRSKTRVTGPFTVEAVPAPTVRPLDDILGRDTPACDGSVARSGQTLRQADWRDELFKTGIRGTAGQSISFARWTAPGVPLAACRGRDPSGRRRGRPGARERHGVQPERVVVCFGPDHAPLEQRQVARAVEEAHRLVPTPASSCSRHFSLIPRHPRISTRLDGQG